MAELNIEKMAQRVAKKVIQELRDDVSHHSMDAAAGRIRGR